MGDYTDGDLLAYIDGVVPPEVAGEIERTPELMNRVSALRKLEGSLKVRLFRCDCPDPQQLGEYHLNLLPASQMSEIRQHLKRCPHCAEELSRLETFMAPGLFERARVVIAKLLSGGPSASFQPAAGVRGEERGPRIYLAGNLQIILETEAEPSRPERRSLTGLITGELAGGMEVQLISADLPPVSTLAGETGEFAFSDIVPGEYSLRVRIPEEEIQVPPFLIE